MGCRAECALAALLLGRGILASRAKAACAGVQECGSVSAVRPTAPHALPAGLVETSTNLASIKPLPASSDGKAGFAVQCSTRSSLMPALEQVRGALPRSAAAVVVCLGAHLCLWCTAAEWQAGPGLSSCTAPMPAGAVFHHQDWPPVRCRGGAGGYLQCRNCLPAEPCRAAT